VGVTAGRRACELSRGFIAALFKFANSRYHSRLAERKRPMKRLAFAAAAALALVGQPALADESATNFVKLFNDVCIGKFGHLTMVWDWADSQNLLPITNPQALAVFAGRPNKDGKMTSFAGGGVPGSGKAWAVNDPAGRFVLATRLDPESCVAWAQKADPAEVDAAYAKLVAQAAGPGIEVKLADDKTVDVPGGTVHIRVYHVWSGSPLNSYALVAATVSRSGGPFQAMLETQRLVERDDVINPFVPLQPPG
jgi:hypothetical protein